MKEIFLRPPARQVIRVPEWYITSAEAVQLAGVTRHDLRHLRRWGQVRFLYHSGYGYLYHQTDIQQVGVRVAPGKTKPFKLVYVRPLGAS